MIGTSPNGFWYKLKAGDSLENVSKQFSVDKYEIQKINNIYDPEDIEIGMKIYIPKAITYVRPKTINNNRYESTTASFIWPSPGTISSGYGRRHGRMHEGIDITRDKGRDIRAAADGIVEYAGRKNGFGNTIIISHSSNIKTLYAHNSKLYVKKGMRVRKGTIISKMGSSGRSSGIHLHFEVHVNGKPRNPLRYLPIR